MSTSNGGDSVEVSSAECECCGLTEECTAEYIARVREGHAGRWICGLCSEAVKDEIRRSTGPISTEEALDRHATFSKTFQSSSPTENMLAAMRHLLLRSPGRRMRSTPNSPRRVYSLARSESCFPTLAG